MTKNVVLLFGLPRSGTTWLGKIFDSHPRTLYRHEPDSVNKINEIPLIPNGLTAEQEQFLSDYCNTIVSDRSLKVVGKAPLFRKNYLSLAEFSAYGVGAWISRVGQIAGVSLSVFGAPRTLERNSILVWKSIESLGRLPALVHALPGATAFHIVRHPCGFVASINRGEKQMRFDDKRAASEAINMLRLLLDTPVGESWQLTLADLRSMHPDERLAWRWAVFNDSTALATEVNCRVKIFSYEGVCKDPMGTIRSLFEFAGLDVARQVEEFISRSTGSNNQDYYSVFKDPTSAAWRWREELGHERTTRILNLVQKSRVYNLLYAQEHDM